MQYSIGCSYFIDPLRQCFIRINCLVEIIVGTSPGSCLSVSRLFTGTYAWYDEGMLQIMAHIESPRTNPDGNNSQRGKTVAIILLIASAALVMQHYVFMRRLFPQKGENFSLFERIGVSFAEKAFQSSSNWWCRRMQGCGGEIHADQSSQAESVTPLHRAPWLMPRIERIENRASSPYNSQSVHNVSMSQSLKLSFALRGYFQATLML